jgi:hypothetical protein
LHLLYFFCAYIKKKIKTLNEKKLIKDKELSSLFIIFAWLDIFLYFLSFYFVGKLKKMSDSSYSLSVFLRSSKFVCIIFLRQIKNEVWIVVTLLE